MKILLGLAVLVSVSLLSEAQYGSYVPINYNGTHPDVPLTCENNPLGYYCITQFNYEGTGNTPTSFTFSGVGGLKVEVIVEPFDLASTVAFTISDQKVRGNGLAMHCDDAVDGTLTFECDDGDGCPNSDISIWFRVTFSNSTTDPNPENWCNERGSLANAPSSLIRAPSNTDNNVDQDMSRDGSGHVITTSIWLVCLLLLTKWLFM